MHAHARRSHLSNRLALFTGASKYWWSQKTAAPGAKHRVDSTNHKAKTAAVAHAPVRTKWPVAHVSSSVARQRERCKLMRTGSSEFIDVADGPHGCYTFGLNLYFNAGPEVETGHNRDCHARDVSDALHNACEQLLVQVPTTSNAPQLSLASSNQPAASPARFGSPALPVYTRACACLQARGPVPLEKNTLPAAQTGYGHRTVRDTRAGQERCVDESFHGAPPPVRASLRPVGKRASRTSPGRGPGGP